MDVEFVKNIAEREEIERKGPQGRALGDVCSDLGGVGSERFKLYELAVAGEVRLCG